VLGYNITSTEIAMQGKYTVTVRRTYTDIVQIEASGKLDLITHNIKDYPVTQQENLERHPLRAIPANVKFEVLQVTTNFPEI
jgi:hypothetical protein